MVYGARNSLAGQIWVYLFKCTESTKVGAKVKFLPPYSPDLSPIELCWSLLGMWISPNEGAKFRLSVLIEIHNSGVKDILIGCVDGLTGFTNAIEIVFPKTQVQLESIEVLCITDKF